MKPGGHDLRDSRASLQDGPVRSLERDPAFVEAVQHLDARFRIAHPLRAEQRVRAFARHRLRPQSSVRGKLRVNTDAFTSRLLLSPHLRRFLDQYPDIALELIARDPRRLPVRRRHRADQGDRHPGPAGKRSARRSVPRLARRTLPALRALPVPAPAGGQGARVHGLRGVLPGGRKPGASARSSPRSPARTATATARRAA